MSETYQEQIRRKWAETPEPGKSKSMPTPKAKPKVAKTKSAKK